MILHYLYLSETQIFNDIDLYSRRTKSNERVVKKIKKDLYLFELFYQIFEIAPLFLIH